MQRLAIALWLLASVVAATADARAKPTALTPAQIRAIVETFARSQVDNGSAIGIEVGVTLGHKPPLFFSYGLSRYGTSSRPQERFTEDTLFQIGSVTKIFTTNLLGQFVAHQSSVLAKELSQFAAQLGTLPTNVGAVTLKDTGSSMESSSPR